MSHIMRYQDNEHLPTREPMGRVKIRRVRRASSPRVRTTKNVKVAR